MKKIFSTLVAGLMISAQMFAVTPKEVCGQYKGDLYIAWEDPLDRAIYLVPGVTDNTLTFVLPNFSFLGLDLGNIVLPNIQIAENGQLNIEPTTLYMPAPLNQRVGIELLQNYDYEGEKYSSIVTADRATVTLAIDAGYDDPIIVYFNGDVVANNYQFPNGGFEGAWANNEPKGWHSFGSATGEMVDFVKNNTDQMVQSNEVRPGSEDAHSVLLSSKLVLGVPANGNLTNGRINAGSSTADSPENNFNFSDPTEQGFNTPFNGRPDSIVFWAKYLPADRNAANEKNKARVNTVITTNARYQDPESATFAEAKIGAATLDYSATADFGWQRLAVPFTYVPDVEAEPAYVLTTFSTNNKPAGGTTYSTGKGESKVTVVDSLFLDDVEFIYNKELTSLTRDDAPLTFVDRIATVDAAYCDDCAKLVGVADGQSTQIFIAYDAIHKCVLVYVVADDYAQLKRYNMYIVKFTDSNLDGLNPTFAAVENNVVEVVCEKMIRDGRLVIRRGNNVYDVTGSLLK